MQIIPVQDTPNQQVQITLGGQPCTINLYQTLDQGFYCDLYVGGALVIGGVICQNLNRIVRDLYFGFVGDLAWNDLQGSSDPSSPGLGTRYEFLYLTPADLGGRG
jgi:hypothetical protein